MTQTFKTALETLVKWRRIDDNDNGFSRNEGKHAIQTLHHIFDAAKAALEIAAADDGSRILTNGIISINLDKHELYIEDKNANLGPKQFDLALFLMRNKGKVCKSQDILLNVWGSGHRDDIQYLRVCISDIRKRLAFDPRLDGLLISKSSVGYMMDELP